MLGSHLETPLAVPLLWENNEHRAPRCIALHRPVYTAHCRSSVDLSERGKGYTQLYSTGVRYRSHSQDSGSLFEAGKSRLPENPTSYQGGIDRDKRTQAMGGMLLHPDIVGTESLIKRHRRDPSQAGILWRALAMLVRGSETLSANPCLLMARAREKAQQRLSPFLI